MKFLGVLALAVALTGFAAPAHADPPPPGCQRVPIFGLNPQIMEVCDLPIEPDGSWTRFRSFSHPEFVGSGCGKYQYHTSSGFFCPDWAPHDSTPAYQGPVETYVVTADTVPPGEPGYIGG
jgi:hypothetical protein